MPIFQFFYFWGNFTNRLVKCIGIFMKKINILIVDDIQILREGLKAILEKNNTICIAGMAADGKEAYDICLHTNIDIVLMDMYMPNYDGAYGIKVIKKDFPHIKILVLTTFDDDSTINAAVNSGADGYILKEINEDMIFQSIISTYNGLSVFCNQAYKNISSQLIQTNVPSASDNTIPLTDKEKELIHYVAQGLDNKEISAKIYLSDGTVRNNISKLLTKLNLKDRTQLAVFAVKNGLD